MIKTHKRLFQSLLLSISLILVSDNIFAQSNKKAIIDIQKVIDVDDFFTKYIDEYINGKDEKCSEGEFYYYIIFYNNEQFFISRVFEDFNNFMLTCDAYLEVSGKKIFIQKNNFWQKYFIETGRYKSFSFFKTDNDFFTPFGYQSDAIFYKIDKEKIILERIEKCH